jgi:hypothetical protein
MVIGSAHHNNRSNIDNSDTSRCGNSSDYKMIVKAIPLQALTIPEGARSLRLPNFFRQSAHEVGKVVSPTHRLPLPPENIPGTYFC